MMDKKAAFILTFNRPVALNRQIKCWADAGWNVHIFSNHPIVHIDEENMNRYDNIFINNLSYPESNSYCARSWNQMFIRAFHVFGFKNAVFVQDDTNCHPAFPKWVDNARSQYDFIWGPAGDQFFYMDINVLKKVGWFDERFLGCYCGDADFVKRVALTYDRTKLSITELHDWGFTINPLGIEDAIPRDIGNKACDCNYVNQDQENQAKAADGSNTNVALAQSWKHFKEKWGAPGNGINGIGSTLEYHKQLVPDIDWYPWFTAKYLKD